MKQENRILEKVLFYRYCIYYNKLENLYILQINKNLYHLRLSTFTTEQLVQLNTLEYCSIRELIEQPFQLVEYIIVNNDIFHIVKAEIEYP